MGVYRLKITVETDPIEVVADSAEQAAIDVFEELTVEEIGIKTWKYRVLDKKGDDLFDIFFQDTNWGEIENLIKQQLNPAQREAIISSIGKARLTLEDPFWKSIDVEFLEDSDDRLLVRLYEQVAKKLKIPKKERIV